MEPAGVSGPVTISDRRSYIKIEIYTANIPQKSMVLCVNFVMSSKWTVVRFLFGIIIFVVVV